LRSASRSVLVLVGLSALSAGCAVTPPKKDIPAVSPRATFLSAPVPMVRKIPEPRVGGFAFADVAKRAKTLAGASYEDSAKTAPKAFTDIGYDQWRDIRFISDKALWKKEGLPFQVQFFHPGYLYSRTVQINVIEDGKVRNIPFSKDLFTYGLNHPEGDLPVDLGFAGFRLHAPINRPGVYDEVIVFLGASYFRAVAQGQRYGLSARGLAVNSAASSGEEFPAFKEFWIVRPEASDDQITLYALLDGPSVSGAYEFIVKPGKETVVDVKVRLWPRRDIDKLGLAPATSMFYYDEHSTLEAKHLDFRPEIHDSDGLFFALGNGEKVWRPFVNPERLMINSFHAIDIQTYGVLQRDTVFDHYQDLETRYDARPSLWITPTPQVDDRIWKEGHIEIIQIPTPNEFNDNIVAFWVPQAKATKGQELTYSYRMRWASPESGYAMAYADSTLLSMSPDRKNRKFIVDFKGKAIEALPAESKVDAELSVTGGGRIVEKQVLKNEVTGGWRLVFAIEQEKRPGLAQLIPGFENVVELRACLKNGDEVLSETWSYAVEF